MSTGTDVDFEAVKQVQQKTWAAGDFALVATAGVIVGERLCEAVNVLPGERVLDVACGSGNTTLAAARRSWGGTVGLDFVPELIEHGKKRAAAERLEIEWVEGDAESLPFADASFDVVLSSFGAMFAPNQPRMAAELLRVCRPGGRIGMANWTPDGLVWGTEDRLRELFAHGISNLQIERQALKFRFRSVNHMLEFFRTYFGPTKMAYERLDEAGRDAFESDMRALLEPRNEAGDQAFAASAEYLEVVATRA